MPPANLQGVTKTVNHNRLSNTYIQTTLIVYPAVSTELVTISSVGSIQLLPLCKNLPGAESR